MALIKFGGGITEMRGSMAGNVFSRNRSGAYIRARTTPTNPNSVGQQAVRSCLSALTVRWSQTLTAAQRTAWNLYAASVAMTNKLGETMFLSGFNHYIRSNAILLRNGETPVDAGPTIFELPETDPSMLITASEATQQISVAYDDTLAWLDVDGAFLHIFQGAPQNPQRNYFNGPWKYADSEAGDSATPPTTPMTVAAVWPFAELQHLFIYARIQMGDGRLSPPFRANCYGAA